MQVIEKKRKAAQFTFLIASITLFLLLIVQTLKVAHAFCPYVQICFGLHTILGKVNHLYYPIATILGFLVIIITVFIGRFFCGWICPFGTIQELVKSFSLKYIEKKKCSKRDMNFNYDRKLKFTKYLVFLFTVFATIFTVQSVYMLFCPVLSLSYPKTYLVMLLPWISLITIFILPLIWERFWCRYLCPYAALMNITQYLGQFIKLKRKYVYRNLEVCVECRLCVRVCPMNIDLLDTEFVKDVECIKCFKCLCICPKKQALTYCKDKDS